MDAARFGRVLDGLEYLARDLSRRGYPLAPVVRQLARELVAARLSEPTGGCAGCGVALVQPATGRPRKWCSERCRRRRVTETAGNPSGVSLSDVDSPVQDRGAADTAA